MANAADLCVWCHHWKSLHDGLGCRAPGCQCRSCYEPRPAFRDGLSLAETITPEWCMETFYRVNPGASSTLNHMPSLYLLDFARAVLARAANSTAEGAP